MLTRANFVEISAEEIARAEPRPRRRSGRGQKPGRGLPSSSACSAAASAARKIVTRNCLGRPNGARDAIVYDDVVLVAVAKPAAMARAGPAPPAQGRGAARRGPGQVFPRYRQRRSRHAAARRAGGDERARPLAPRPAGDLRRHSASPEARADAGDPPGAGRRAARLKRRGRDGSPEAGAGGADRRWWRSAVSSRTSG